MIFSPASNMALSSSGVLRAIRIRRRNRWRAMYFQRR
jgi:hypothetical protein